MNRAVLVPLVLAGCLGASPANPHDGAELLASSTVCDLETPDGAIIDCGARLDPPPVTTGAPGLTTGWRCLSEYTADGMIFKTFSHPDGRVAAYFDVVPFKQNGFPVVHLIMVGSEETRHLAARHTDHALLVMDRLPAGERIDQYSAYYHFRVLLREPGQDWRVAGPDEAQLIVADWAGIPWYAWQIERPDGTYYLSAMEHDDDEDDELLKYNPTGGKGVLADGTQYIAEARGEGVKRLQGSPLAYAAATGICHMEPLLA